jgi:hypothetical protein
MSTIVPVEFLKAAGATVCGPPANFVIRNCGKDRLMSIAKVIEITAESPQSFEAAIQEGIERASKSVKDIQSAWINQQKVDIKDGKVAAYRVDMKITFLVHD